MNTLEMSKDGYLLLLHSNEWWKQLRREELERYVAESNAWLEKLMASGKVKAGRALARRGAIVSGKNGRVVSDGPFTESKETIGGYFLLTVGSMAEAVAIAQQCPGLPHGVRVEVRPIAPECPLKTDLRSEPQLAHL
jgi:hypothetical protein